MKEHHWWVEEGEGEDEGLFFVCDEETVSPDTTVMETESKKLAHLIAAAPDMLDALEELVCSVVWEDGKVTRSTRGKVRTAIDKARGSK